MSLLEDVFLEDEAGEAQELERVIEGDELDDRPRSPDSNENSEKEDEAEEDRRVVDHTAKAKRVVKNPRFVLNPARLTGPRGIQVIPEHFKDFKFKGKNHEREDLDLILKKLEHWAYRLYPKFKFDDCLKKIETLGKKRPVMVHLHKIRTDQYLSEETVQQQDSSGDEAAPPQEEDEFDRLLQQQIELARSTPAPGSARKEMHTPMSNHQRSPLTLPKVTSSPSISDEQKERMMRNRRLAEERRLARLNQSNNSNQNAINCTETIQERTEETNTDNITVSNAEETKNNKENDVTENNDEIDMEPVVKKNNRSNVIDSDSSDDENVLAINESITADVHTSVAKDVPNTVENKFDAENVTDENNLDKENKTDENNSYKENIIGEALEF
ncbi:protein TIPIN homolog [Leguminivora glycinivorella]|uniref:protein TIPIN homolog n=1 Tax=Leguminivora glycinivorella TaxID=1035111 RepID=UPI00200BFF7E|nr:protein TIPIN homolog [Leguminivora glycinivorella]